MLTLLGVALTKLGLISVYNVVFTGCKFGTGLGGLGQHIARE